MLSVVIPVYNRLENLKICLEALARQKDAPEFEVIVVDDGSTDRVKEYIIDKNYAWSNPAWSWLGYLSGGPNKGFRGGRARNIGAFNANGSRLVFIDSDVALNEYGLVHYANAAVASPDAVIVGRYFYLPKIDFGDNKSLLWETTSYEELSARLKSAGKPVTLEAGDIIDYGKDLGGRPEEDFTDDPSQTKKSDGLGALSGNISYPMDLFLALGGFDEHIIGHGGEDADLGLTARSHSADWLFYRPIVGYHIWHTRDQARNHREVQANIAYIDAKHGIGTYANAEKTSESRDFSDPIHYHKHQGGIAIKMQFDPTVFAARPDLLTAIGITDPRWFARLGFSSDDILIVDKTSLDRYKLAGTTAGRE